MKFWMLAVSITTLSGCSMTSEKQNADMSAFLDSRSEVAVIKATVRNPLPDCSKGDLIDGASNADLSVPRSIRGYLKNKEGRLCKKTQ